MRPAGRENGTTQYMCGEGRVETAGHADGFNVECGVKGEEPSDGD